MKERTKNFSLKCGWGKILSLLLILTMVAGFVPVIGSTVVTAEAAVEGFPVVTPYSFEGAATASGTTPTAVTATTIYTLTANPGSLTFSRKNVYLTGTATISSLNVGNGSHVTIGPGITVKGAVSVSGNAQLEIAGGSVQGKTVIDSTSTLLLSSGAIEKTNNGAVVCSGTFCMTGGAVRDNITSAPCIFWGKYGSHIMFYGGEFSGNVNYNPQYFIKWPKNLSSMDNTASAYMIYCEGETVIDGLTVTKNRNGDELGSGGASPMMVFTNWTSDTAHPEIRYPVKTYLLRMDMYDNDIYTNAIIFVDEYYIANTYISNTSTNLAGFKESGSVDGVYVPSDSPLMSSILNGEVNPFACTQLSEYANSMIQGAYEGPVTAPLYGGISPAAGYSIEHIYGESRITTSFTDAEKATLLENATVKITNNRIVYTGAGICVILLNGEKVNYMPADARATSVKAPDITGKVGDTIDLACTKVGGTDGGTWSISTGKLPAGLSLEASTGKITGKLTTVEKGTYTATYTNGAGATKSPEANYVISSNTIAPTIAEYPDLPNGTEGSKYTGPNPKVTGTTPIKWSATGLPNGLTINATSGIIEGTPANGTAGTYDNVVIKASNGTAPDATIKKSITILPKSYTIDLPGAGGYHVMLGEWANDNSYNLDFKSSAPVDGLTVTTAFTGAFKDKGYKVSDFLTISGAAVNGDGFRVTVTPPAGRKSVRSCVVKITVSCNGDSKDYVIVVPGDVNASGTINSSDVTEMLKVINGMKEMPAKGSSGNYCYELMNLNGSGSVNVTDASIALRMANGIIETN